MRLCSGPNIPRAAVYYGYDAPEDVLTTGVDDFVDQVNRLEPPPEPSPGQHVYCADDGGETRTAAEIVFHRMAQCDLVWSRVFFHSNGVVFECMLDLHHVFPEKKVITIREVLCRSLDPSDESCGSNVH